MKIMLLGAMIGSMLFAGEAYAGGKAETTRPKIEITVALHTPPETIEHRAVKMFQQKVEAASGGRITVRAFPGAALGGERENFEQLKVGVVQLSIHGDLLINTFAADRAATVIPFIFPNVDAVFEAWDGRLGGMIRESLEAQGLVIVGLQIRGSRHMTSNVPIRTPADLKGLKLRVPEIPSWVRVWSQLGALPTPIAFPEVYTSLQLGVADAQENPYGLILSSKFYEVQEYLINTNHLHAIFHWTASKRFLDGLTPEDRQLILTSINESVKWANDETRASIAKFFQGLKDNNMKVIEVDTAAFRRLALPAIQEIAKGWAPGVYNEVRKFLE